MAEEIKVVINGDNLASPALQGAAEDLGAVADAGLETDSELEKLKLNFKRLGVDINTLTPILSRFEATTLGTFRAIATNSKATGDQIKAAFESALSKIKSPEGIQKMEVELEKLRASGKLSEAQLRDLGVALEAVGKKAQQAGNDFEDTEKKTSGLAEGLEEIAQSSGGLGTALDAIKNPAVALGGALVGLGTAFISINKSYQDTVSQLTALTGSQEKATAAMEYAKYIASTLGTDVNETAKTWVAFNSTMQALGQTSAQSSQFFETLSYSILATGGSMDDVMDTVEEFREGLTDGTLNGENLEQILRERLPRALEGMAAATGKSTEEFTDWLKESQDITEILPVMEQGIRQAYGAMSQTQGLDASLGRLKIAFEGLFVDTQTGAMEGVATAINAITGAVQGLDKAVEVSQSYVSRWIEQLGLVKDFLSGDLSWSDFKKQSADLAKSLEQDINDIEEAEKKRAEAGKKASEEQATGFKSAEQKAKELSKAIDDIIDGLDYLSDKGEQAGKAIEVALEKAKPKDAKEGYDSMAEALAKLGETGKFTSAELQQGLMPTLQKMGDIELKRTYAEANAELQALPATGGAALDALAIKQAATAEAARRMGVEMADGGDKVRGLASNFDILIDSSSISSTQLMNSFISAAKGAKSMDELGVGIDKLNKAYASGRLSSEEYGESIDTIRQRQIDMAKETPGFAKSMSDLGIETAEQSKQNAITIERDYNAIKASGTATGNDVKTAFLQMAEAHLKAAAVAGQAPPAFLASEAAANGLGEAYADLRDNITSAVTQIAAVVDNYDDMATAMEREHNAARDAADAQMEHTETLLAAAVAAEDLGEMTRLSVDLMGQKVDAGKQEATFLRESAKLASDKADAVAKEARMAGDYTEKTREVIESLREEAREKGVAADKAEEHATQLEQEAWSAESVNKIIDDQSAIIQKNHKEKQDSIALENDLLSLDKQIAEAKGDSAKAEEIEGKIKENNIKITKDKAAASREEADAANSTVGALREQAEADGVVTEAEQSGIAAAREKADALDEQADAAEKTAAKQEELAKATKEAKEEAERQKVKAAELKAQGDAVSDMFAQWTSRLAEISPAAVEAFQAVRAGAGASAGALDTAAQNSRDMVEAIKGGKDGFVGFANKVAVDALRVEAAFIGQKNTVDQLTARLDAYANGTAGATENAVMLLKSAETAAQGMRSLDQAQLERLKSSIESARQKMLALRDASMSALGAAQQAYLSALKDDAGLLQIERQQKILEIQKQIAEARAAGDQEAIRNLNKALELTEKTYNIKRKDLEAESKKSKTQTTSTSSSSGGGTIDTDKIVSALKENNKNSTVNLTLNSSEPIDEKFVRNKLLPMLGKANRSLA